MAFTPHPNTGSTWWVKRLRVAAARAARRRDMATLMSRPRGPLLRPLAPGEVSAMAGMLSLTASEQARRDIDTPTGRVHDLAIDMGGFTERTPDTDGDTGGGVR